MDIYEWIIKEYPEPKHYHTRLFERIRNAQIIALERFMLIAMDNLNREPEDILDDLMFELYFSEKNCQLAENKMLRRKAYEALEKLSLYLKGGRNYYDGTK